MEMYNKLPRSIKIKNREIFVNADYRIFIKFEKEMQDNDTKKAIRNVLSAFYPAFLLRYGINDEMIEKFIWFYRCGKIEEETGKTLAKTGKSKEERLFDYEIDSDLIYSAFMETYHIDLSKDFIHWWKFKALFKGLNSETEFCKIKGYRSYKGKDENLLELKNFYKLPPTKEQILNKSRQEKIYEALQNQQKR